MTSLPTSTAVARIAARLLLDAGCVQFRHDEPFRLPSGWASPVYMDCRRLISFPAMRRRMVEMALERLHERGGLEGVASIVGAESSGIALAAWMADGLNLPLQYVRKKSIGFGQRNQVEGVVQRGDRALLVDDVMAAGHSKIRFIDAMRSAGLQVRNVFVVFDYGTFGAVDALARLDVAVQALATWHDVLAIARESDAADPASLAELATFIDAPEAWSREHGGIAATS